MTRCAAGAASATIRHARSMTSSPFAGTRRETVTTTGPAAGHPGGGVHGASFAELGRNRSVSTPFGMNRTLAAGNPEASRLRLVAVESDTTAV